MIHLYKLALLFVVFVMCSPVASASQTQTTEIPRTVLGLYDEKMNADPFYTSLHHGAEMPLNYLGLQMVYRPVQRPFPSDDEMKNMRGVLTWFTKIDSVADPASYCLWLKKQIDNGKKIVILEEPGIFADKRRILIPECKSVYKALGVTYGNNWGDNPYFMEIVSKDPRMVEFDRKLDLNERLEFLLFKPFSKKIKIYLSMRRKDDPVNVSALVFTGPSGGLAASTFVSYRNDVLNKEQWRLNPFLFFEEAFGVQGLPRPDVTTLEGRRLFFSQIDGDGIFNVSHIDQESFSGEIIDREILKKYPLVPISVSLIAGYLDQTEFKSPRITKLYESLLNNSNCEIGSHGYAHPLIWRTGKVALDIPGYKYSSTKEINGSIEMINQLLSSLHIPKKVALFQWTGDGIPQATDIEKTYLARMPNLNGGGSRFDEKSESILSVFPIGLLKGNYRQIYATTGNENDFTNLWHGPYYGYSTVIESFKNFDKPRRIKPIDVYYHFYSGERTAALDSLKKVYDTVLLWPIFPVTSSHYATLAGDFFVTKIYPLDGSGYRITDNGELKTIRFDNELRNVDLERSKGVHGFDSMDGNLYVHLDETDTHDIFLTSLKPHSPYVKNASFEVRKFLGNSSLLTFSKRGWTKSEIILGGMKPQKKYQILATRESVTAFGNGGKTILVPPQTETFLATSDRNGNLSLTFSKPENDGPSVKVTIKQ